jgi:hypothetical protein
MVGEDAAAEAPAAAYDGGGSSSYEIEELRDRDEELQQEIDEANDTIFEQFAKRMTILGHTALLLQWDSEDIYVRAWRLNTLFSNQITEKLGFHAEIEYEDADGVGVGGGVVRVRQAFIEWRIASFLGTRIGNMLMPFGYFNVNHQNWRYPFILRPLMNEWIFPSTYADVGMEIFGNLADTDNVQLDYQIGVVNGLTNNVMAQGQTDVEGLRDARPRFGTDNNQGKSYVGRLQLSLGDHLLLGASGYWGPYAETGSDGITMAGADIMAQWDALVLRAEGVFVHIDDGERLIDHDNDPLTPDIMAPFASSMTGAVAEAEIRFFPSSFKDTFLGAFDDPKFYLAARLDVASIQFPDESKDEMILGAAIGYRPILRSALSMSFAKGVGDFALEDDWRFNIGLSVGF